MINEEILQVCQDELIKLSSGLESTNTELLNVISSKIGSYFKIKSFQLTESTRGNVKYIIYQFIDAYDNVCMAAFKFEPNSIIETFTSHIVSIVTGEQALRVLNDLTDDYKTESGVAIDVQYQWGRSKFCTLGAWDFDKTVVRLSEQSLLSLIDLYDSGENSFKLRIKNLIESSELGKRNIVEFIKHFDKLDIHRELNAKIQQTNLETLLTRCMIQKNDAVDIVKKNRDIHGIQNILVLYIVNQLGLFAVLSNWKVDYSNKTISISIVDDQVIDLESATIISNFGICSRIEQTLRLNDSELKNIFDGQAS